MEEKKIDVNFTEGIKIDMSKSNQYVMGVGIPAAGVSTVHDGYSHVEFLKKEIKVKRVDERAILPEIKLGNVGIDLRVLTENNEPEVTIEPKGFYKFRTGIKVELPYGYYLDVVPRSSTGCKKDLMLKNTVGIIDNNFRGELLVFVYNFGNEPLVVQDNERLFQMIIRKDESINFTIKEVDELSTTERGENGFGSSGRM